MTPDKILTIVLAVVGGIILLGLIVSFVRKPKNENPENTEEKGEVYLHTEGFVLKGNRYPEGGGIYYIIEGFVESLDSLYPDVKWIKFRVQKGAMRLRIIWSKANSSYELVDLQDCHYPAIGFEMY